VSLPCLGDFMLRDSSVGWVEDNDKVNERVPRDECLSMMTNRTDHALLAL